MHKIKFKQVVVAERGSACKLTVCGTRDLRNDCIGMDILYLGEIDMVLS